MPVYSKTEILAALEQIQQTLSATVAQVSPTQLHQVTTDAWSAADYLKHLIITIKPIAKALSMPVENLERMFGKADHATRSYDEIIAAYQARINEGMRAEDAPTVLPVSYRFPEGVQVGDIASETAHLTQTWVEANQRLQSIVAQWDEPMLDQYMLPHPAINLLTIREMLFFTIHHNDLHTRDIQRVLGQ